MSRQKGVDVADIFRLYGPDFKREHPLPLWQLKAMSAIERCRTAKMGGHVEQCDKCEHKRISYNSCRNRHCPKCQTGAREKWLFDRKQELLAIDYYHIVFTVPDAYDKNILQLVGGTAHLKIRTHFLVLKRKLYDKKWVTYCKGSYQKTEPMINYLARYTHRVAMSNSRIDMLKNGRVTFKWRDYKDHNRSRLMTLEANEFIRRFLLHILPKGFYKIRYYGLFSNRNRRQKLDLCRKLLRVSTKSKEHFNLLDVLFNLTGIDFSRCPQCQQGHMRIIKHIEPIPHAPP